MCNENVEGDKCDKCKTGYGVFPACDQCIDEYHDFPVTFYTMTFSTYQYFA